MSPVASCSRSISSFDRVVGGEEGLTCSEAPTDIAAAFQEAVVDVITSKAVLACKENGITDLLLGGGVAANSRLRELTGQRCSSAGITLHVPPLPLCTDNGAMVAALGSQLIMAGIAPSGVAFAPDSSLPVTTVSV